MSALSARAHAAELRSNSNAATVTSSDQQTLNLLQRIAVGSTLAERERALALGYEAYLEEQLHPEQLADDAIENLLQEHTPTVFYDNEALLDYARNSPGGPIRIAIELQAARVMRTLFSTRQLFESMVEFCSDVFSIHQSDAALMVHKTGDDASVPRSHALGRFRDLLGASARSPAMLIYLDNASNGRAGINENYARELLELHTLGVNGGYSEDDVVEVARCFSGWSLSLGGAYFQFRATWHDYGAKQVLGVTIPTGGGVDDGEVVLNLLAAHPSTARHIATRLTRRFVSDTPPEALIDDIAAEFQASSGDLRPVTRALFLHPLTRGLPLSKVKRPQEYLLSALRVLQAVPTEAGLRELLQNLRSLGHLPFQWPAPNGYPDAAGYWLNSNAMLTRWNAAFSLTATESQSRWRIPWSRLLSSGATLTEAVDALAEALALTPMSSNERNDWLFRARQLQNGADPDAPINAATRATLTALMLASPRFQQR